MTSADLLALAERCEQAAGADRELDCLIHKAVYPDQRVMFDHGKAFGPGPKRPAEWGRLGDFPMTGWDDWVGVGRHVSAQPVTASLDAAMTLVPPMHDWSVGLCGEDDNGPWACLTACDEERGYPDYKGSATTPALALTAASLRARQALSPEGATTDE